MRTELPDGSTLTLERTFLSGKPSPRSYLPGLLALLVFAVATALAESGRDLAASGATVFGRGEWWRLVSSVAVHADLGHFLANSFFFLILSSLLTGYFGAWVFPALSIGAGALVNALVLSFYPPQVVIIGASGVVYFMAAFWLTLYCLIQRQHSWSKRILLTTGFALMLFFPTSYEPHTSYAAHGIGFGLGGTAGAAYFAVAKDRLREAERYLVRYAPASVSELMEPESSEDEILD